MLCFSCNAFSSGSLDSTSFTSTFSDQLCSLPVNSGLWQEHRSGYGSYGMVRAARLRWVCWVQAVMQECDAVFGELLGLRSMCWRLARTWLDCCHHPGEPSPPAGRALVQPEAQAAQQSRPTILAAFRAFMAEHSAHMYR